MFISVIVPVRNESAALGPTLRALLTQDYDPDAFEVLVADGRSDDGTADLARATAAEFPRHRVRVLDNPGRLSSAARNVAIRASAGEAVLLVDGHCAIPTDQYLARVARSFAESGADCLGRPQPLRGGDLSFFQRCLATARESRLGHNPDSEIYGTDPKPVKAENVAVAYRRGVFDQVGLFDESFDACEDVELNTRVDRAGLSCVFDPALRVDYHPRRTLGGLFRQMARYGRGRRRLARKHPGSLTAAALVPPAWVLFAALGWLPALLWPPLLMGYLTGVALYAGAVLGESVRLASRHGWAKLVWLPALFAAIHAGFGWGFLRECARTGRSR